MAKLATITMVVTTFSLRIKERIACRHSDSCVRTADINHSPSETRRANSITHRGNWGQRWARLSTGCSVLSLTGWQLDPAFLPPCGSSPFVSGFLASFICSPATLQMPLSADIAYRHCCWDKTPGGIGREDCISARSFRVQSVMFRGRLILSWLQGRSGENGFGFSVFLFLFSLALQVKEWCCP